MKMLAELSWMLALPVCIFATISLAFTFVICVCGCRTKERKDELTGVEGRVKITNPEDYTQEVNANNIPGEPDKSQSTAKRSLPDLPVDSSANARGDVTWEPNGDATSELYATVVLQDEKNKKHNRQKSETDSMSPSLTYSKVKADHPYDKLKKIEHPYAQVKDKNKATSSTSHQANLTQEEKFRHQQNEEEIEVSNRNDSESTVNIPAANAIAGHVTASDDLPYMTPPAHFSGDSQDSGKGYTSISVREPLSAIRAESKVTAVRKADPHYATVSDDSDDMYAAIDDPNQVYTSESETYAQIHPESERARPKSAPQPPSVDSLKQMTISSHSHSRQASSSSLASSTIVSSPKQEKRPVNSPLPPTPTRSPDSTEELCSSGDRSFRQSGSPRNLEDMYAKVNKKGRREIDHFERGGSIESGTSESSDSMSYKLQSTTTTTTTETSRSCHSYLSKSTLGDTPTSTPNKRDGVDTSSISENDPQSGYEKLGGSSLEIDGKSDPGYETVNKGSPSESDPEYEKLKPQKRSYVNVESAKIQVDGYAAESDFSDGYARVKADSQEVDIYAKIESDGYARVEPHEAATDDGYAKVFKHNNNKAEPNYEKILVPDADETKLSDHLGEPTYESLANELDDPNDPNYESVRFPQTPAHAEPPYQLLRDCESGMTQQ